MMRWDELKENASAGATGSASVATAPTALGGLGVGFDPNGDKGIYQTKKAKKPIVIKRVTEGATGLTLGDLCAIATNFKDADFWLLRKGSENTVGMPSKEYSPEYIGIKVVDKETLDPKYLYYMMQYLHTNDIFKNMATGTLKLRHITVGQIKAIPVNKK